MLKPFINSLKSNTNGSLIESLAKGYNLIFENSSIDLASVGNKMLDNAVDLLKQVNELGYEAYIVGGAARDMLMGDDNIHDIDISTNMPMDEIKKHFDWFSTGGEKHGTLVVRNGGDEFEMTQFRTEGGYTDSRRPDEVTFIQSFEEDTARRDLTINAIGIDANGTVIDFHGGQEDIKNKKIRTVGKASERFTEDFLRMMRAVRFASKFEYEMDDDAFDSIAQHAGSISMVSKERILDELQKMSTYGAKKFAHGIEVLRDTDMFGYVFGIPYPDGLVEQIANADDITIPVMFALVYSDVGDEKMESLVRSMFKPQLDYIRAAKYILRSADAIRGQVDPMKAIEIVKNPYFSQLETYLKAKSMSSDRSGDLDIIKKVATAHSVLPQIVQRVNKKLADAGYKGSEFRDAQQAVIKRLYHMGTNINNEAEIDKLINSL